MELGALPVVVLQLLLVLIASSNDVTGDPLPVIFYPFGTDQGDSVAPTNDDGFTSPVTMNPPFPFFGTSQGSVYVNTNGDLSFSSGFGTYTPSQFPLVGVPMIAPFWADVDTLLNNGRVFYRQSTNLALLTRASLDIQATFSTSGFKSFTATWIFIATWSNVTYFGGSTATPTNTFQCVLITDGTHSFAMFNYATITWTTGTASGGNALTGLGGTPAQVGFNFGDASNYYAVPTSRTSNIVNIYQQTNIGIKGRWIFRVDGSQIASAGCQFTPACPLDANTGLCAGSGMCSYQGDPHYTTCDGKRFDYMGICKYLLVGVVTGTATTSGSLPSFQVYGRNEYRNNNNLVSWYKDVEIVYGNDTIQLTRNLVTASATALVQVNGAVVTLPYCQPKYTIYYSGKYVRYQANFGLAVETDGHFTVNIYIPPSYRGLVNGLCGNCDGLASNDMVINSVNYQNQPTQFGDHFIVPDTAPDRPTTCPSLPATPLCSPLPQSYVTRCQQLTDLNGPFGACVRAMDAAIPGTSTAIYNGCLLDACYANNTVICQHVWNMVEQCAFMGFQINCDLWQTATQCPVVCSSGMVFECNSNRVCMPTCDNPLVSSACTRAQKGACVCPMGQLLYNGTCTASCPLGCVDSQNNIHPVGDIWNQVGCTQLTCVACANCPYGHQVVNVSACSNSQVCSNNVCVTAPSTTVPSSTTHAPTTPTTTPQRPNSYIIYNCNGGVLTYGPSSSSLNGLGLATIDNINLATTFVFATPCLASQVPNANLSSGQCVSLQADDGSALIAVNVMGGVSMMSTVSTQTQFSCLFNVDASVFLRRLVPTDNFVNLQSVGFNSFYYSSAGVSQPVVMYNSNGLQLPSSACYYFQLAYTGFSTVSTTCPNVWTLANMARPSTLGSLQGNFSISYCRQLCLVYPKCIGVSIQNNLCAEGSFPCYFTISGAANQSLVIDPTFIHYDLTPTYPAPCTGGCVVTWTDQTVTITNSTTPGWYSSTASQTTAKDCRAQCQSTMSCVGLKWVSSGGMCTLYYRTSMVGTLVSASTFTMQVPNVNTLCDKCSDVINVLMNVSDPAASPQGGYQTGYQTCLTLCLNNAKCAGFQLQAGGVCYLSLGTQMTSSVVSSYSYYDVRRSPCGNGCQNKWKLFSNTASVISVPYTGTLSVLSEQDCRSACMTVALTNPTACVGVDYNASTNSCRFNTGAPQNVVLNTNPSTAAGWNHFELSLSSSCYSD